VNGIRLSKKEIEAIVKTADEIFGKSVKVYLFGSRTDPNKKGGDIDLFLETDIAEPLALQKKIQFKIKLQKIIGEQSIDVIIPSLSSKNIVNEAKKTGVLLNEK